MMFFTVITKDGYLHLIETKVHCYLALVLPAAAAAVILMAISYKTEKQTLSPDRLFLFLIAFGSLLSTLLSQGIKSSFLGSIGWSMGSIYAQRKTDRRRSGNACLRLCGTAEAAGQKCGVGAL